LHVIKEHTREGARSHIGQLEEHLDLLGSLPRAGCKQAYDEMLPVMQELSLLSKTQYGGDADISERLSSLRTHAEHICGNVKSDGHGIQQHLVWAKSELSDLNEIMVLEPKSEPDS
jgi:hypothetical protein